jgi:hypothetical protein
LDFTAQQRTCKLAGYHGLLIPLPEQVIEHALLATFSWVFLGVCVCMCVLRHDKRRSSKTRGVSHCGLAIYIKKYVKAKEELGKLKYFTMQTYNLQKILSKSFKIL